MISILSCDFNNTMVHWRFAMKGESVWLCQLSAEEAFFEIQPMGAKIGERDKSRGSGTELQ